MFFNFKNQPLSFLGVCSGLGQSQQGVENGPRALRSVGIIHKISKESSDFQDLGDIELESHGLLNQWDVIFAVREKAYQALKKKRALITIGGDHSIAIGTIQATLMVYPDTRVVWMDAHGDMNTPETSTSGNLHGMPLAALLGLFVNPLGGPHLRPENLILIGVRDLDPAEVAFIDHLKIKVITSKEARAHPDRALHALNEWLDQVEPAPIHLSFDIDSLDPEWAPATGLRVPLGLQFDFCKKLVLQLAKRNRMVSFDLVEINPEQTFSGLELKRTLDCAQDILLSAFNISSPKEITL